MSSAPGIADSPLTRMRRRDFVGLAAASALLASAPRPARAQAPKRGGVLRHVGFDRPTFDIHGSVSYQTQLVSSFVNRTLFKFVGIGVDLQIVNEEYGNYIRGSFLGKFDETSWGPSSLFTEVDSFLYNIHHTGQPSNRSHVSDTKLDVMLDAQRRYTARSSRKKVIDDIQRLCAEQVYYVYTPFPKNLSSWNSRVKNYGPKNSFDRGAQLEVVWLDA